MKKLFFILIFLGTSCAHDDINECVNPDKWGKIIACPQNIDPVCGCNGITYDNECYAKGAGVTTWQHGTCP